MNLSLSVLMIFLLSAASPFNLNAQQPSIKGSQLSFPYNLSQQQLAKYNKLINSDLYTSHQRIDFPSLDTLQFNGHIHVSIPGHYCQKLVFRAKDVQYVSENDYTWYGKLIPQDTVDCSEGSITLISTAHGRIGHILVDEDAYEILDLGPGKTVLSKIDDNKFTENECGVDSTTLVYDEQIHGSNSTERNNGNCDVRCLVLFTENAVAAEPGNIVNRVNLGINQTNMGLLNSNVIPSDLRVILVGVLPFDFEETQAIGVDVVNFASNADVQQLRDDFEADIVILMTQGNYASSLGRVRAIGPIEDLAFAIVETETATAKFTFSHEVGHLFGGGHNDDDREGIPHGHNFFLGLKKKGTIMNTLTNARSRIQHFSNPDVKYSGKKTGIKDERDNARQLRNEACAVANFRETIVGFQVIITGDQYACPCESGYVTAFTHGGAPGTYTFEWFVSPDGINWTLLPYSTSSAAVEVPCEEGEGVFVRVDATSSDNQTMSSTRFVEAATSWPGQEGPCVRSSHQQHTTAPQAFRVAAFPNPTQDSWRISVQMPQEDILHLDFFDLSGKLVRSDRYAALNKGAHTFYILENELGTGLYFLRTTTGSGDIQILKLVKF